MKDLMKGLLKRILSKVLKPTIIVRNNSYSQCGEDVIVKFIFDQLRINQPTFLELGVCNPDHNNNTFLFYQNGSRGVCVEADVDLIPAIKIVRGEDTILNIGVGVTNATEAEFFVFNEKGLNTFDREEAHLRQRHGTFNIDKIIKVPLKTINQIISENFNSYPDYLSIDIEGLDLSVLQTLNYAEYPIPIICAETCLFSENHIRPKNKSIEDFMLKAGYFVYADTYINTIFVNKRWYESQP